MSNAISYRPEIDGLRTVAVVPVVLFHAGVDFFSGGFVGVNIFFVISGYLITKIIYTEIQQKTFTVKNFYQKRLDRLLPVLLAVLTFVMLVTFFISPPQEYQGIAKSVLAALTFTSNIYFWMTSDYFAASAFTIPLLHTWSLGIEEQFYIFFPLFLLVAYKFRVHNYAVVAGAIASFLLAAIFINYSATATFYLLPFRAWELLLGSILALGILPEIRSRLLSNLLSLVGLGLIVGSILLLTKSSQFPGLNALAPTLGAMLIIYATTHSQNLITRLLSHSVLVVTGKASYSIYMWHWPIIVFYGLIFGFPNSLVGKLALVAATLAVGFASWRLIEKPTRGKLSRLAPIKTFYLAGLACLPLVAFSSVALIQNGIPDRVGPEATKIELMAQDFSQFRAECHINNDRTRAYEEFCVLGNKEVPPTTVVWGDSHGVEIAAALGERLLAAGESVRQITYSACSPLIGLKKDDGTGCDSHNVSVLESLKADSNLDTIILTMNYHYNENWSYATTHSFNQTMKMLEHTGKKLVVMYPLPQTVDGAPAIMSRRLILGDPKFSSQTTEYFLASRDAAIKTIDSQDQPNLLKLKTWELFCDEDCYLGDAQGAYFFDAHHPSMHGARKIADSILQSLGITGSNGLATEGSADKSYAPKTP